VDEHFVHFKEFARKYKYRCAWYRKFTVHSLFTKRFACK